MKEIKGFEDYYLIDESGKVFSKQTNKFLSPYFRKSKKSNPNSKKYWFVVFTVKGKQTAKYIHRLVAETFIENTEKKKTVNHKDGNTENNNVENLEWATFSEQQIHAFSKKLNYAVNSKPVNCFNYKTKEFVKTYSSLTEAAKDIGTTTSNVSNVLRGYVIKKGKRKNVRQTKGYYFTFV